MTTATETRQYDFSAYRKHSEPVSYIVTKSEHGEDRMFAGCVDFKATWTLQADKARKFSAALAIELLRDFAEYTDARIVTGHPVLGPRVITGKDHKTYIVGC